MKNIYKQSSLVLLFLTMALSAFCQENTWDQKEHFVIKRARSASFTIGSIGYVCAGLDSVVRNDLWQYDPGTDVWSQLADLPGSVRRNPVSFSLNGMGYVGTGHSGEYSATGTTLEDFYKYDPVLNTWTQIADYPGAGGNGVYFATGFATSNFGYVSCGKIGTANYDDDLWKYNDASDTWTQCTSFPGGERYNLMSFVVDEIAYLGFGSDQDFFLNDLWAYDEIADSWQQMADCPGAPRAAGGTFSLNGRGFICCGADGGFKEDLWEYDPIQDRWKIRAYYPTDGRRYGISFSINDKGYFGCGKGSFGKKRSMYEYNPMTVFGWKEEEAALSELSKKAVVVYPNPAVESFYVSWQEGLNVSSAELRALNSEVVKNIRVYGTDALIQREGLVSGGYLLTLIDADNHIITTRKIMLK